jgi:hypothetical protein
MVLTTQNRKRKGMRLELKADDSTPSELEHDADSAEEEQFK